MNMLQYNLVLCMRLMKLMRRIPCSTIYNNFLNMTIGNVECVYNKIDVRINYKWMKCV